MFRNVLIGVLAVAAAVGGTALTRHWLEPAQAQSMGFHAIAVSTAPASSNVTHAWFIGQDGSARFCIAGQSPAPTCQTVPLR